MFDQCVDVMEFYDIIAEDLTTIDDTGEFPKLKSYAHEGIISTFNQDVCIPHDEVDDTYICSDVQFNDYSRISLGFRKFSDIKQHNDIIINNLNKVDGKILHLGDFSKGSVIEARRLLGRINCSFENVTGNHDIDDNNNMRDIPFSHYNMFRLLVGFEDYPTIIFTHYPLNTEVIPDGCYNVHGHFHDCRFISKKHINVTMENIDYKPKNLRKILEELD